MGLDLGKLVNHEPIFGALACHQHEERPVTGLVAQRKVGVEEDQTLGGLCEILHCDEGGLVVQALRSDHGCEALDLVRDQQVDSNSAQQLHDLVALPRERDNRADATLDDRLHVRVLHVIVLL
eukprot:4211405-Prymnesium_polylepis.1